MMLNLLLLTPFVPHGHCYLWQPNLVSLHLISDALIGLAYYAIPLSLLYFARQRQDIPFRRLLLLFSAFILCCGTTHLMAIWTLWHPDYWVSGTIKAVTALISVYTALVLIPIIPQALALKGPAAFQTLNQQLQQEIDVRKQSERILAEREAQSQAILAAIPDLILRVGADGVYRGMDAHTELALCGDGAALVGQAIADVLPPALAEQQLRGIQLALETGQLQIYEQQVQVGGASAQQHHRQYEEVRIIKSHEDEALIMVRDISQHHAVVTALQESRAMYSSILANISDAVFITAESGEFTFICPNVETIFGYSEAEIAAQKSIHALLAPDLFDPAELKQQREITNREQRIQDKNGQPHDLLVNVKQVDIAGGSWLYTCRDISDRKQSEAQLLQIKDQLAQQEQRFRSTFEQAAVGIAHVSPQGALVRLNQRFCQIAGYPREELLALTFQDITYPDDLSMDLAYVEELLAGERDTYTMEKRYVRKDRSITWINLTVSLVHHPNGDPHYFIAVIEDINARKQTEIRLQEMNYALNSAAIVAKTDASGTITFANDKLCALSQYTEAELLGQNHRLLNSGYHPSDFFKDLWCTISHGKIWRGEIKNRAKDGSLYWVDTTIVPFLNAQGHAYQHLAIRFDITDRKALEAQLQQEIRERRQALKGLEKTSRRLAESNQELQDFAYVASHDLQEPLRKIQAFGDRLKTTERTTLSAKSQDYLARMLNAAERAQTLIQDLLAFSRVTTKANPFIPTDLGVVLQGVLSDLEVAIEQTGAILTIDPLPTIDADSLQMRQVFQNLLSNALKFKTAEVAPQIQIRAHYPLEDNPDHCEIRVIDNGIGFEQQYEDRIFQPFQRLHGRQVYDGSGIGLAICRKVARRHWGTLRAESSLGEGSTFILTLPLHHPQDEDETKG